MSTIDDPLIDLAWAMIFHEQGGMDPEYCQTPRQLQQCYSQVTGHSLEQFDWYQAFAAWKLGIVLEGSYFRIHGRATDAARTTFCGVRKMS